MPDKYDLSKCVFAGRLKVLWELGQGSHGEVLLVEDSDSKTYSTKTASAGSFTVKLLEHEYKVYQHLQCHKKKIVGLPQVFKYGFDHRHEKHVLVMSRLGASLRDVMKLNRVPIPEYATLRIGCQLIRRLKYVHSMGLVHGDIKPRNILCGHRTFEKVYLVDFGLATFYKNMKSDKHNCMKTGQQFKGTEEFASRNTHRGFSLSRRDDMESLGYTLIYMMKGSLPWSKSPLHECQSGNSILENEEPTDAFLKSKEKGYVKAMKENTDIDALCEGLPECISNYMRYVDGLGFEESPDYSRLINEMEERMDQLKRTGGEDNGSELNIWTVPFERSRYMRTGREKEIWADYMQERNAEEGEDVLGHNENGDKNVQSITNAIEEPEEDRRSNFSWNPFHCLRASKNTRVSLDEYSEEGSELSSVQPHPNIFKSSQKWWAKLLTFFKILKPTPEPVALYYSLEGFTSEWEERCW